MMDITEFKTNQQGFTLIELIVVMAIMGILAIGSVAGFRLLDSGSAKHASELVLSKLDYIQLANMTKAKNYTLEISKSPATGDYVMKVVVSSGPSGSTVEETETLELKDGEIAFYNNLNEIITVSSSQTLTVSFRKDSGGVKEYSPGRTVNRIIMKSAGQSFSIRLVTATGKHFIET